METLTDLSDPKTASAPAEDSACVGASTRGQSMESATNPKIETADVHPSPPPPSSSSPKSVSWSSDLVREAPPSPPEGNPYVTPAPVSSKNTMESVKEVLGNWGKKLGETAKKTEDLAGNFWQHSPNFGASI